MAIGAVTLEPNAIDFQKCYQILLRRVITTKTTLRRPQKDCYSSRLFLAVDRFRDSLMSLLGQCPECRTEMELSPQSLGVTLRCQCGVNLTVEELDGRSEILVECNKCDGSYVVDRRGAGETVQCKCGKTLTIPNICLSAGSISADVETTPLTQEIDPVPFDAIEQDSATPSADSPANESTAKNSQIDELANERPESSSECAHSPVEAVSDSNDLACIRCPGCANEYQVPRNEIGDEGECECGTIFIMVYDYGATDLALKTEFDLNDPFAARSFHATRVIEARQESHVKQAVSSRTRSSQRNVVDDGAIDLVDEELESDPHSFASSLALAAASLPMILIVVIAVYRWFKLEPSPIIDAPPQLLVKPIPAPHPDTQSNPQHKTNPTHESASTDNSPAALAFLKELRTGVDRLLGKDTVSRQDLFALSQRIETLRTFKELQTPKNIIWLGETWRDLAEKSKASEIADRCRQQAQAAFRFAKSLDGLSQSQSEKLELRIAELDHLRME